MLLFCNTDKEGNIQGSLKGEFVVPDRQYDHFFYMQEDIADVSQYRVATDGNGTVQLVPKEPSAEEETGSTEETNDTPMLVEGEPKEAE
ncbi:hypothetical protein [Marinococcus halophilus]|uniref:hypothetical protein n=1 Tax=Marinococcus halophilus TaxID=1371 RepID=UPI0009A57155|nr:hypothetical protein [Marinococcus halophilus]